MSETKKVFIAGAGGIGKAVALMLADYYKEEIEIVIGDVRVEACQNALKYISLGVGTNYNPVKIITMPAQGITAELEKILNNGHILLDCLPSRARGAR